MCPMMEKMTKPDRMLVRASKPTTIRVSLWLVVCRGCWNLCWRAAMISKLLGKTGFGKLVLKRSSNVFWLCNKKPKLAHQGFII